MFLPRSWFCVSKSLFFLRKKQKKRRETFFWPPVVLISDPVLLSTPRTKRDAKRNENEKKSERIKAYIVGFQMMCVGRSLYVRGSVDVIIRRNNRLYLFLLHLLSVFELIFFSFFKSSTKKSFSLALFCFFKRQTGVVFFLNNPSRLLSSEAKKRQKKKSQQNVSRTSAQPYWRSFWEKKALLFKKKCLLFKIPAAVSSEE